MKFFVAALKIKNDLLSINQLTKPNKRYILSLVLGGGGLLEQGVLIERGLNRENPDCRVQSTTVFDEISCAEKAQILGAGAQNSC